MIKWVKVKHLELPVVDYLQQFLADQRTISLGVASLQFLKGEREVGSRPKKALPPSSPCGHNRPKNQIDNE